MIRLTHLSGSLRGSTSTSPKAVVRIGRGADCDVRFDPTHDTKVSTHHAQIVFENGHYFVIDTNSSNGTLVNGKRVSRHKLREGDKIHFGQGGPEVKFELDDGRAMKPVSARQPAQPVPYGQTPPSPYGVTPAQARPVPHSDKDAQKVAAEAQQKIAQARAMSGGQNSGQTMFIMADALQQVEVATASSSKKRWVKVVLGVVAVAACIMGAMGVVIWQQKKQIEAIAQKKGNLDKQIQNLQLKMQVTDDPEQLASLEEQLKMLTGKAQAAIGEMEQKDKAKADELANAGDELDREIRKILRKFDADTYAVPPVFKERLKFYLEKAQENPATLRAVWRKKQQYWPLIVKEFSALGLPEEIAYVAWQESHFDPFAESAVGAKGMWQFMDFRAREFGLRVDKHVDERTDVPKATHAAAKYLYNLLSEFGSDSFMLAIASYNKGENGMRRVLHSVGFRKEQRDFWHLYRLKKLPDETMEYVPQILAWAIIGSNPQKYGLQ